MTAKSPYEILKEYLSEEWLWDNECLAALEDLNNRALPVLPEGWRISRFNQSRLTGNYSLEIAKAGYAYIKGLGKTPREAVMNALKEIK